MILHNLIKTCETSPAQWTATNEQGQGVYIRYRFDTLTVHCPFDPVADEVKDWDHFMSTQILAKEHVFNDPLRGWLDEDEMLKLTGYTLGAEGDAQ